MRETLLSFGEPAPWLNGVDATHSCPWKSMGTKGDKSISAALNFGPLVTDELAHALAARPISTPVVVLNEDHEFIA